MDKDDSQSHQLRPGGRGAVSLREPCLSSVTISLYGQEIALLSALRRTPRNDTLVVVGAVVYTVVYDMVRFGGVKGAKWSVCAQLVVLTSS